MYLDSFYKKILDVLTRKDEPPGSPAECHRYGVLEAQVCRYEKGGYCKLARDKCATQNCPLPIKSNKIH